MDANYLVWSNEHRAWWGPGGRGYTAQLSEAGRYSKEQALNICTNAMPGTSERMGMLPELPVLVQDAEAMRARFRAQYPATSAEAWE